MQNKSKHRLRMLILSACFAAMGVVLGQYFSIKIGNSIRIGFGALPVILAGALFGPWVGMLVGAVSDIVGCAIFYGLGNMIPLVTLGMMSEGFLSGVIAKEHTPLRLTLATVAARVTGSLVFRSIGLYLRYKTPLLELLFRIPCVAIESVLIALLLIQLLCRSKALTKILKGWRKSDDDLR